MDSAVSFPQPPDLDIIHHAVEQALAEDVRCGDITSIALLDPTQHATARIFTKQAGILAGLVVAQTVFDQVSDQFIRSLSKRADHDPISRQQPSISSECRNRLEERKVSCNNESADQIPFQKRSILKPQKQDGERLQKGDTILRISGPARDLLTAERTALNFLQHLSGIATQTAHYAQALSGTKTRILDTRKTTPGLRALEKYAVRCGGGFNHRMGLYDQFLIKDNHIALMKSHGGLPEAVAHARAFNPSAQLTVEAETLEQVQELVKLKVDRILLDNMSNEMLAEAVRIIAGRCQTEASGNMSLERVAAVAATGVDYISVGAITHSAPALDLSLEIEAV